MDGDAAAGAAVAVVQTEARPGQLPFHFPGADDLLAAISRRILRPLGLRHTSFPRTSTPAATTAVSVSGAFSTASRWNCSQW